MWGWRLRGGGGGKLLRQLVRELSGMREQLSYQTELLRVLVRHYVPESLVQAEQPGEAGGSALAAEPPAEVWGGVSFLDPVEASLVEAYSQKTQEDIGRPPSEDEVLAWLADEKTQDLHRRLRERESLAAYESMRNRQHR